MAPEHLDKSVKPPLISVNSLNESAKFEISPLKHINVAILGCGTLGKSLLNSWINVDSNALSPKQIHISTLSRKSLDKLKSDYPQLLSENLVDSNESLVKNTDIIIVCVKPYIALNIFKQIGGHCKGKIIISCCAGISWSDIYSSIHDLSCSRDTFDPIIIRAVPSVTCRFQMGITSLYSGVHSNTLTGSQKNMVTFLFSETGKVFWMNEESVLNVGIALGASSPAWISVMIEAFADGAVAMGMPRIMAIEMACQSMLGTANYLLQSQQLSRLDSIHPAQLKDLVATPGGCTIVGLATMERGSVRGDLMSTLIDCVKFLNERDAVKK